MRPELALFIDPPSHHLESDRLFDEEAHAFGGDRLLAPYAHLRRDLARRGVPVHTGDVLASGAFRADRNIYVSMGLRTRWRGLQGRADVSLAAFFALECPIVEPRLYADLPSAADAFERVFTFCDAQHLEPFVPRQVVSATFRIPQSFDRVHEPLWAVRDRKFLVMINANKRPRLSVAELYTERLRAVAYFAQRGEIDLYGVGWDVPPYRSGETWLPAVGQRLVRRSQAAAQRVRPDPLLAAARSAWRGPVRSKSQALAEYDFALCFENMVLPGWITEKVFDCLLVGTVPVYLGAPEITDVLPAEAFVDARRFSGYQELGAYLTAMPAAEREAMRAAGRAYLESEPYAREFSTHAFSARFEQILREDASWSG